ncbi:HugZ family pyridoxamine 5'-phosphate oxidase [Endothiovibrio diazotrophicus]
MDAQTAYRLGCLLADGRWAALATVADGVPLASWISYVAEPGLAGCLFHLSTMAAHTRNLLAEPRVSLAISEADDGREDPQTLARVTLNGTVAVIGRDEAGYEAAKARYLQRLPEAAPRFEFGDFALYRLAVIEARLVGGFAQAYRLGPPGLKQAAEALEEKKG